MKGRKHKAKYEAETVIDIMMNGGASAVFHGMGEEDAKRIMVYPYAYSKGFHFVIVNGVLTVENEKHTEAREGKPLYGPGRTRR
jgi:hypothetical protein